MDYDSMLKLVKVQNPGISHKEAQKLASAKFKEFKTATESFKGTDSSVPDIKLKDLNTNKLPETDSAESSVKVKPKPEITISELVAAEKRLRAEPTDINSIITIGRQVIRDGEIVKHGKEGVNTLVTWEDKEGNKLPLTDYFRVFI